MGMTSAFMGIGAAFGGAAVSQKCAADKVVALAGNPNVGKSTVFNQLTGMRQHTGNWPGKTVANARGTYTFEGERYEVIDIPGTYSLAANLAEEEVARDVICFGGADAVVIVCDATCLERNMNMVLQTLEITGNVVVCVNLMDEAKRKGIMVDFRRLEEALGIPVVGASAAKGVGMPELMAAVARAAGRVDETERAPVIYADSIERAVNLLEAALKNKFPKKPGGKPNARWAALKLLEGDQVLVEKISAVMDMDAASDPQVANAMERARGILDSAGLSGDSFKDTVVSSIVRSAEDVCSNAVFFSRAEYNEMDRKIDRVLLSKTTGTPIMLVALAMVLWLSIAGSNYPSQWISRALFSVQDNLLYLCGYAGAPWWVSDIMILGVYRVLAWVVSVMLPPMAIFFPMFTLLEDLGYLPRVAFNLDNRFKKCHACGKQALTMCMVCINLHKQALRNLTFCKK